MATKPSDSAPVPFKKPLIRLPGSFLALPATVWLFVFFMIPLVSVVQMSFWEKGPRDSIIRETTYENYEYVEEKLIKPNYSENEDGELERNPGVLERSVRLALNTTLICLAMGYPIAFFVSTRKKAWVRQLTLFLIILPFWTNFVIRTYAWQVILGNRGVFNHYALELHAINWDIIGLQVRPFAWILRGVPYEILYTPKAVLIGMVYGFLPFMILPIYANVERFDFRLVEAAHDLGANDWSAFLRVILPNTLPGVVAGCLLVFIPAIGSYITPELLGGQQGRMIGSFIAIYFEQRHYPRGAATAITMMVVVFIGLFFYLLASQSENAAKRKNTTITDRGLGVVQKVLSFPFFLLGEASAWLSRTFVLSQPVKIFRDMTIRRIGKAILFLAPMANYLFLWLPIMLLVLFSFNSSDSTGVMRGLSFRWYEKIFNSVSQSDESFSTEIMFKSLQNSLIVGITATIIATIIGTMVAMALVRSRFWWKGILSGILYLPVGIPEIAQAFSLLIFFNLLFEEVAKLVGVTWEFGFNTIIIGHVAFNISFVAVVVQARLADMNPRYEEAARDLGANEWQTFWRVTFPLILPGVMAGALLAFTLSLDDFVITFFTQGVGTSTLTVYVYGLVKLGVSPEINALSTLMIIGSTVLVGFSLMLQGGDEAIEKLVAFFNKILPIARIGGFTGRIISRISQD